MRWWLLASAPVALILTAGLFAVMHELVAPSAEVPVQDSDLRVVELVRLIRPEQAPVSAPGRVRLPPRPPPRRAPEASPPPRVTSSTRPPPPGAPRLPFPSLSLSLELSLDPGAGAPLPAIEPGPGDGAAAGLPGTLGDRPLLPLLQVPPRYPERARRRRVEGWVRLNFTVTERGEVTDVEVVASEPRRTFDAAAVEAARRWRFRPRTLGGRPVAERLTQVLQFRLGAR